MKLKPHRRLPKVFDRLYVVQAKYPTLNGRRMIDLLKFGGTASSQETKTPTTMRRFKNRHRGLNWIGPPIIGNVPWDWGYDIEQAWLDHFRGRYSPFANSDEAFIVPLKNHAAVIKEWRVWVAWYATNPEALYW